MISPEKMVMLELVQVNGISKLLLEKCDILLLEDRINSLKNTGVRDVKKSISHLSRKELIDLIKICPEINDSDIESVYEQYRYGLKPGFILCYLGNDCGKLELSELTSCISTILLNVEYDEDEQYKNLRLKNVEVITADTLEISFSFLSKHSYLSENETPEYVYEYKESFVWLSISGGYLAIKTAPSKIVSLIKRVISEVYKTSVMSVCMTEQMINTIFGNNKIKRGTYFKPNAGSDEAQKVTIADANLAEKPNVRGAYDNYDMTSSSLEETINEDVSSTLGINCKQGKIYLSKNLSATELRSWSIKRIKEIIHYIKDVRLESQEAYDVLNPMDHKAFRCFSQTQKAEINRVLFCLYCMGKYSLDSYNVLSTTNDLLSKCDRYFYKEFMCEAGDDFEECIPSCIECGSTHFSILKSGKVSCMSCGNQQVATYDFLDDRGKEQHFLGVERFVCLLPSHDLQEAIWLVLDELYGINLEDYESFYIWDGTLSLIKKKTNGGRISLRDIGELKRISDVKLEQKERADLLDKYRNIKEKCSRHSNEACNVCSYTNLRCIMSLFICFDFRPSPHQNSEFGDVSFQVTYQGKQCTLVGIAKSKNSSDTLTTSSKEAREMIQQVLTMSHDARADIIAVICPMRFHPQLENEIDYIGKLSGKKIIYFDDEFMARLLKYNLMNKEITTSVS